MKKVKRVKLIDREDLKTLLSFINFVKENIEEGNLIVVLEELDRFENIVLRNFKED